MEIVETWIGSKSGDHAGAAAELVKEYVTRSSRFCDTGRECFASEAAFWAWVDRQSGRGGVNVLLLDPRGEQMGSEAFAKRLGHWRDNGVRRLVAAIGPADGWSEASLGRANFVLSLGKMTLPHQLARAVLAEQIYRALTILAGHPYHCGH